MRSEGGSIRIFEETLHSPLVMKIAVVGTGYVGLVTGTCFLRNGQ